MVSYRSGWVAIVLATGVALSTLPAAADHAETGQKRALIEQRMKQVRAKLLRDEVGLDAATAEKVERIMNRSAPERRKLHMELQKHRHALGDLLKKDSNDQAAYRRAIAGIRAAQHKLHQKRQQELDAIGKLLTPKQQAKFMQAVRSATRNLRQEMRRYHERKGNKP